ncbi:TetR-like C-terminal domain-containing protein [Streptomyces avicenniae]|uniref:TetR-like C-terminal domain-containing protein n=1 Tax=Streptomyces avicenniae TaxID=500153 RepID=UPI00069B9F3E|nr:TetR-like C-terminal domain-containing protein [Streptomyces avicenniae]
MRKDDDGTAGEAAPPLRRRGERLRQAALATTVRLLATRPLHEVTIAAVARETGLHETSLYRRWGTRENLIHDAATQYSDDVLPLPDTGSVRGDLLALAEGLARAVATPEGAALLQLSVRPTAAQAEDAGGEDPEAVAARRAEHRAAYWEERLRLAQTLVRRGVERGELSPGHDASVVVEAVCAPVLTRALFGGPPPDGRFLTGLVDLALYGGAPEP